MPELVYCGSVRASEVTPELQKELKTFTDPFGDRQADPDECPDCEGWGLLLAEHRWLLPERCPVCLGTGRASDK
jgi:DnaJ-class molecular chaperone